MTDPSTPAGIGNLASAALLDYRHRDGANQLGDEPGGLPGVPYSDYTAYEPVNSPMDIRFPFDPASVHDPDRWQPLRYVDGSGASEHDLDQAVKLFFALTNAIFDAGICAWDDKRAYDSVRPITAIRLTFCGQPIRAWAGPGRGTETILGEQWFPYQPTA